MNTPDQETRPEHNWISRRVVDSIAMPGVRFIIHRMTFGRRLELMRMIRDLAARLEYFEAGRDGKNVMEASVLGAEMDRLYVSWGIEEISGLRLDGVVATTDWLINCGPETLFHEALTAVKAEIGLSETERKN